MYCAHFGFTKSPFRITPDPELFYAGGNRGAVLDALVYAVGRGEGIVEVVGEVGSGKTMLCRMLERELPAHCEIVYLANPRLGADEILEAIALELKLEVPAGAGKVALTHLLQDYLLTRHAADRRVVMFVEEAQAMPLETLEEIRLLSNLETSRDKLLQTVLFGQPELDTKLARHEIRQLKERITYRFALAPLATDEVRDYLDARARACGYRGNRLFTGTAVRAIARHAEGLARRINVLADKALLAAYARGERRVGWRHVRMAARDSEFRPLRGRRAGWRLAGVALSIAALVAIGWQASRLVQGTAGSGTAEVAVGPGERVDAGPASLAQQIERAGRLVGLQLDLRGGAGRGTPTSHAGADLSGTQYRDLAAISVVLAGNDYAPGEAEATDGLSAQQAAFRALDALTGGDLDVLTLDPAPVRFDFAQ